MQRERTSIPLFTVLLIPCFFIGMMRPAFSQTERHPFFGKVQKDRSEAQKNSSEVQKNVLDVYKTASVILKDSSVILKDSLEINKDSSFTLRMNDSLRIDNRRSVDRFSLEEVSPEIKFKLSGNRLIIENIPTDGMVEVYNIMGAKILQQKVRAGSAEISLSVPRGYYIIKIDKFSRKIAIK